MAVDPKEFFNERQGAAVLKHGILKRYLAVFTGKLGSTSTDHKVFFLDAYAGPGEYDGGGEGSPAIAKATAELLAANRNLVGIYVEADDENRAKLAAFLAASQHQHHVLAGEIQSNVDRVLEIVGHAPLLAFFDPFGLPVPIEQLQCLMNRPRAPARPYPPPTELIVHVSYPGIARLCGFINSEKAKTDERVRKQRDSIIKKCNEQLGGDWWQEIAKKREDGWVEQIAHGYAKKLKELTGAGWFRVEVRDRPGGRVAYELLLVSTYTREALWAFHEQVSLANEDWRKFNAAHSEQAELPLNENTWVEAIKANIVELMASGDFEMREKWVEAYGPTTFGLARSKHVRKAIKALYKTGVTTCDGVGEIIEMRLTRGAKAPALRQVEAPHGNAPKTT